MLPQGRTFYPSPAQGWLGSVVAGSGMAA